MMDLIETAFLEDQNYELSSKELITSIPKWNIQPEPLNLASRESEFKISYELVCEEDLDGLVTLTEEEDEL